MKIFSGKISLMTKLSVLVTFSVLLVLTVLGIYFDGFLKERFLEDTHQRMQRGYQRLAYNLKATERELRDGIAFVKTDEKFIASIELINNYQDKNNYNAFLIDEEKKAIAEELLSRVKLSFNSDIALYDQNGELVAYVTKVEDGYQLNFLSFDGGDRQIFQRDEHHTVYSNAPLPKSDGNISILHKDYYSAGQMLRGSVVSYHRLGDDVVIKSHQSIFRGDTDKVLAHIEMSSILNGAYFQQFSNDIDLDMRTSFDAKFEPYAGLLNESFSIPAISVVQNKQEYLGVLKKATVSGDLYFVSRLDKHTLNAVLNESRWNFLLLLLFVAAATLILMRYIIHQNLQKPLKYLMEQIRKIESQDYSHSELVASNDELQAISQNVNQLASAVQERESLLQQARSEQEYLSNHDALTNLPNRRFFAHRLEQALDTARRDHSQLAILFLDLDQFKVINDTLGHDVGDELLIQVSKRLTPASNPTQTLARIGGDEFNMLIEGVRDISELRTTVEQLLALFQTAFSCRGLELGISASIGVALYPKDGEDSVTLIKHADLAMYKSKDKGRNNYSFFSDDLAEYIQTRSDMTHAMKQALEAGDQFELYYQPKISLATERISSVEGLIRWHSPKFGRVMPSQFIPIAEETGLIVPIGQWVLQQGCNDFVRLKSEGFSLEHISINLSNVQLHNDNMMLVLRQALAQSGISPNQLELEITESYIANDVNHAIQVLQSIRDMGIGLAIDDFGTGYSSMSYLKKLPVTRIKIDKSFVDGLPENKDSVTLTRAVLTLAKSFELATTAEGVETEEQLSFLKGEHCDEVQGYYYAKPMCFDELREYCRASLDKSKRPSEDNVISLPAVTRK